MTAARRTRSRRRRAPGRPGRTSFSLGDVARAVGGRVLGDPSRRFQGIRGLDQAGPEHLSLVADARHLGQLHRSRAGALLVASEEAAGGRPAVLVASPLEALASWLEASMPRERPKPGVARGARVHRTARLSRGVSVAPGATVGAR
ncbi:MAG: LpxD N-terminal domain-containing protein, partial [Thermoanaerobaculia bacterium]